jgi:KipI family sensor histidine kinase inhibitor
MAPARLTRIAAAGDAALVIDYEPRIDPDINASAIALSAAIRTRCGSAARDVVVGYCTLTVYFDPVSVDPAWLEAQIRTAAEEEPDRGRGESAHIDVPVCYEGELAPDLADVARYGGCSEQDVVARHTARSYRVYIVGFVPGFAYMAEVDPAIAAPRRSSPRTAVTPGSVAIAGGQTGIYPAVTPGGWNIIGRTPVKPYDPARPEPFLFRAGDSVRFHPISRAEFDRLSA